VSKINEISFACIREERGIFLSKLWQTLKIVFNSPQRLTVLFRHASIVVGDLSFEKSHEVRNLKEQFSGQSARYKIYLQRPLASLRGAKRRGNLNPKCGLGFKKFNQISALQFEIATSLRSSQ